MLKNIEDKKTQFEAWCKDYRDELCYLLEKAERAPLTNFPEQEPGKFVCTQWKKNEGKEGGGLMSILKGRVFEKAAVHISTTYGEFSPELRKEIPGAAEDPRYWACGVSVIIHPHSPHIPTAHMNNRMIVTSKQWLGGGADLTPMLKKNRTKEHKTSSLFHHAMKAACDRHSEIVDYEKLSKWCDEYFYLPHRKERRGAGGIFYDYLHSPVEKGGWEADFSFAKALGQAFATIYPEIVRLRASQPFTEKERQEQLAQRGRYVEFNLLYDRGTLFGLKTGGNIEAILSSLPPIVHFP